MAEEWDGAQEEINALHNQVVDDQEGAFDDEDDILDIGEEEVATNEREALLMRFCPHDSSMLYPQVRT